MLDWFCWNYFLFFTGLCHIKVLLCAGCSDYVSVFIVHHLWKTFVYLWWEAEEAAMSEMECHGWIWAVVKTLPVHLHCLPPYSHIIILL